ncbi:MAG: ABC transporter permease [Gammaproteobacteria bacterium]|nr:ABC transporter permease [Gammaproteobacteria bacterium]
MQTVDNKTDADFRGQWLIRPVVLFIGLIAVWQLVTIITQAPVYILPGPIKVLETLTGNLGLIMSHATVTALEIVLGLFIGTLLGIASALCLTYFRPARRWLLPVLVVSQSLPVFALAPVLVLWFGYGLASKVAMAVLIIYFPVAAACYDGLRHTNAGWLDLARTMNASKLAILRQIRFPAALPALASGLRVAAAVAPIGAVVGEWVGSSRGLGYLMLHANGRMQIDLMFAALFVLALLAIVIYFSINWWLGRLLSWQPETLSFTDQE